MNHDLQHSQDRNPDELIDRVLHSLRDTEAPADLNARIAVRLTAHQQRRRTSAVTSPSRLIFAAIVSSAKAPRILLGPTPLYTLAGAATVAVIWISLLHQNHPNTTTQTSLASAPSIASQPKATANPSDVNQTQSPQSFNHTQLHQGFSHIQVPQGFSLGSHNPTRKLGALAPDASPTDPDTLALALAETLAPSHPAPPMPLTQQELALLRATRQGQPIELAELDSMREPALRAIAEQRKNANVDLYIHALLGPIAAAESITPTPPPPDETQPSPVDQSPSSK